MVWINVSGSMGDELGLTGAIRELKRQRPDEMIRMWGRYNAAIFGDLPYLGIGNKDSGELVQLHSYYKDHDGCRTLVNCDKLGLDRSKLVDLLPEIAWSAEELARPLLVKKRRAEADKTLVPIEEVVTADPTKVIAIDPKAGWTSREWPHEKYDRLSLELASRGYYVVQVGAQGKRPLAGASANLVGRVGLREAARFLGRVALFVGNDSGYFHLAAAVGAPHVIVYGITAKTCGPYPGITTPVYPKSACHQACFQDCFRRDANRKRFHCMDEISVDEVLAAVALALSRPRPQSRLVPARSKAEVYTGFMAAAARESAGII